MSAKVDSINIVLMLISCLLAFIFPFELFLFSYIILGPLHYMTELSWLKERRFFLQSAVSWKSLFYLGLSIVVAIIIIDMDETLGYVDYTTTTQVYLSKTVMAMIASAFILALFLLMKSSRQRLIVVGAVSFLGGLWLTESFYFSLIVGIFIPTLIHTTIFTGAFILEGALKNRSSISIVSFFVFVVCNMIFFIVPDISGRLLDNNYVQNIFLEGDFFHINQALNALVYSMTDTFVLDSPNGLRIQGFIAFAYTYHYLNWFSKTEVIKWHHVPRGQLILSIGIWILSIGIHLIDVKVGIMFIALLSMLHVIMEFPLNHRSFINIWRLITAGPHKA